MPSPDPAIINTIQANFMTTISNANIGTNISFCISDLCYKHMDPLVGPIYKELREDYCMCCILRHGRVTSSVQDGATYSYVHVQYN